MENPLKDLHNYSSDLSISQVVKFFQRQGIGFTKTMIQNYVRIGVLKAPVDKRIYRSEHLKALVLLDRLKSVYSLDEIKMLFELMPPEQIYDRYLEMDNIAHEFWGQREINPKEINSKEINSKEINSKEGLLLELAAHCVITKSLTQKLLSQKAE